MRLKQFGFKKRHPAPSTIDFGNRMKIPPNSHSENFGNGKTLSELAKDCPYGYAIGESGYMKMPERLMKRFGLEVKDDSKNM